MRLARSVLATCFLVAGAACGQASSRDAAASAPEENVALPAVPSVAVAAAPPEGARATDWVDVEAASKGDAAHGKALVARYECNRCHAGTGDPAPSFEHQCVHCHQRIAAASLPFPRERLEAWRKATKHFITTPTLDGLGDTLRPSWISAFLVEPVKVRSHQEEWMPRLRMTESDARDIAAFLAVAAPAPGPAVGLGDVTRGRTVVQTRGCLVCHAFTGSPRPDEASAFPAVAGDTLARGMGLAPDLRLARERVRPDVIVRWIVDPKSVRPSAEMPALGLSEDEARDAAAYILRVPLAKPEPAPAFQRLPVLERRVTYEEVAARVFRTSCTHCHADPGPGGDPGPGSTGGFGFAPRGVQLLSYRGTQLGYRDGKGGRRSLFTPEPALDGLGGSRLVAALVARYSEVAGNPVAEVRGMPLGLPPLPAEDIQLVETWVAQGAKE